MTKKGGSDVVGDISLGTDSWNVAEGYTKLKILRQLVLLDRWDTLAQFGAEELGEDLGLTDNQINKRRVEGLQRLHSTIRQLIGNVMFAISKNDKGNVERLLNRVKLAGEYIPKSFEIKENLINHQEEFSIDEKTFQKIIDILQEVKDELNTPLNNAGLIFRVSEEVDLDKIMNSIVEGG